MLLYRYIACIVIIFGTVAILQFVFGFEYRNTQHIVVTILDKEKFKGCPVRCQAGTKGK
jgi:hypothetical protein